MPRTFNIGSNVAYPNGYHSSRRRGTSLDTYSVNMPTNVNISENGPLQKHGPSGGSDRDLVIQPVSKAVLFDLQVVTGL